ncbi:serine/threonine-protein kinase RsbW [Candidatus Magnetomoraceae bacterium gMMP-15]
MNLRLNLQNIREFVDFVVDKAKQQGLRDEQIDKIELSTEEAISNIFYHVYKTKEGFLELSCKSNDTQFIVSIIDFGSPFNIITYKPKFTNMDSNIDNCQIGGLGIKIIKNLIDEIQYSHKAEKNILKLIVTKEN